jgi:hypothetical protein
MKRAKVVVLLALVTLAGCSEETMEIRYEVDGSLIVKCLAGRVPVLDPRGEHRVDVSCVVKP